MTDWKEGSLRGAFTLWTRVSSSPGQAETRISGIIGGLRAYFLHACDLGCSLGEILALQ